MNMPKELFRKALEYTVPWLALAILLIYTYAKFFQHPYGFAWHPVDGSITAVFVGQSGPSIQVGDRLVQAGSRTWKDFNADLAKPLFESVRPGDSVNVVVDRGGQLLTIPWVVPGANAGEIEDQLLSEWFVAYFFWLAGTLTVLVLRPRDLRWFLIAAFDFLTAIWLISGSGLSSYHIWYSALVLRAAIWLCVPVYLHLHWIFPRPLGNLAWPVIAAGYTAGIGLAALQWFQRLPQNLFYVGFLTAILGSLILVLIHFVWQPDMRRDLNFLLIAAVLAFVPAMVLGVAGALLGTTPQVATLSLLSLPVLPFAYLYAAYRSQLGGLEIRVNRLVSIYAFMILLGTLIVPLLALLDRLSPSSPHMILIHGVIATAIVAGLTIWGFPVFQDFIEHRWLGIMLPSRELQQTFTTHISASASFANLTRILQEDVMPSLLVRQFVFVCIDKAVPRTLLSIGLPPEMIPDPEVLARSGSWMEQDIGEASAAIVRQFPWIRLVVPLRVQNEALGYWIFGRRDPDDLYSQLEIPILQSFANQTALALSNILQSERLKAMYQADINRTEKERLSLARDLHDSVLNEMAAILMNADLSAFPSRFQDGYQGLAQRLREIISDLRPPMLNYGLKPAIEELADNMQERSKETMRFDVSIEAKGSRYPQETEQHLFRIVQEACENARRHSRAKVVAISGRLEAAVVELTIEDDGIGFELGKKKVGLDDLLNERHFGLAGMLERAELIDAEISLASAPGKGTQVHVKWSDE